MWELKSFHDLATGKADHRVAYLFEHNATVTFDAIKDVEFESIQAAIDTLLSTLKAKGVNYLYLADLTRFGIPTVRVIMPELEFLPKFFYDFKHRDERSRRLYQVPIRLGYKEGVDFEYKSGLKNNFLI